MWKVKTCMCKKKKKNIKREKKLYLSVLESDLSDQRHTLVLHPRVGQVKVREWAEKHHVRNSLSDWLIDNVIATEPLRLRHLTDRDREKTNQRISKCNALTGLKSQKFRSSLCCVKSVVRLGSNETLLVIIPFWLIYFFNPHQQQQTTGTRFHEGACAVYCWRSCVRCVHGKQLAYESS